MRCPYCGFLESKVIDSRESKKGISIRRRRECLSCKRRFTTYEKIEEIPYMVVKKDGTRQPFDTQKLLRGMMKYQRSGCTGWKTGTAIQPGWQPTFLPKVTL